MRIGPLAIGLVLLLLIVATGRLASEAILREDGQRVDLRQILIVHDLAGMSVRSGSLVLPDVFFPDDSPLTLEELESLYHPETAVPLFFGPDGQRRLLPRAERWIEPLDEPAVDSLMSAWLDSVRRHPGAYLAHRFDLFFSQLGLHRGGPLIVFQFFSNSPFPRPTTFFTPPGRWMVDQIHRLQDSFLFKPWLYLLASLVCLGATLGAGRRHARFSALLTVSAFLYTLTYLPLGAHSGFRYVWWPILAALVQCVIAVDARLPPRSPDGANVPRTTPGDANARGPASSGA